MYIKLKSLYQVKQIQALEQQVIQGELLSRLQLMQRAGRAAWHTLREKWPLCDDLTVCCGSGTNAGDGFVLARLAKEQGCKVRVWAIEDLAHLSAEVVEEAVACQAAGISIEPYQGQSVVSSSIIVDALLGTGLNRCLDGRYMQLVEAINQAEAPVMSLDMPTGIDADSGQVLGVAVKADLTLTFMMPKRGLFTDAGLTYAGEVLCDDLDIDSQLIEDFKAVAYLLDEKLMRTIRIARPRHAHKGDFGHVLVIGGDYGMGGAVRMAAEAAMRVGAGLVSVATRPEHVHVVTGRPELMCHAVCHAEQLQPLLARANVIVIGPGLGQSDWSKTLFAAAMESKKHKIIDADGLNLLSMQPPGQYKWSAAASILTPHPGEAKRLLGVQDAVDQLDRFAMTKKLQEQYGGVVILKGAGSIIQHHDQEAQSVCVAGNPGMASGGMGDVLSGVLGGLLAQGLTTDETARLGVYMHAEAGDMAARHGGERGLLASDLFKYLRQLANANFEDS